MQRVNDGPPSLPSICLYTLLNTHQGYLFLFIYFFILVCALILEFFTRVSALTTLCLHRHMGQFFLGGAEPSLPEKYFDSAWKTAMLTCRIALPDSPHPIIIRISGTSCCWMEWIPFFRSSGSYWTGDVRFHFSVFNCLVRLRIAQKHR